MPSSEPKMTYSHRQRNRLHYINEPILVAEISRDAMVCNSAATCSKRGWDKGKYLGLHIVPLWRPAWETIPYISAWVYAIDTPYRDQEVWAVFYCSILMASHHQHQYSVTDTKKLTRVVNIYICVFKVWSIMLCLEVPRCIHYSYYVWPCNKETRHCGFVSAKFLSQ